LPSFVENEITRISQQLNPVMLSIKDLLFQQKNYDKKTVKVEGSVSTIASIDQTDKATVATWGFNIIPSTVETTSSATYFYLDDNFGGTILVKYLADLDISANDKVAMTGLFNAGTETVEKGFLKVKKEEVPNELGEPFIAALIVENKTRQKVEYIRT